jgi:hypothetical protein
MRVITGTARGRRLREPAGMDIRPTTDKVKEAMFNIIQFDIEGRRVLDLFAGTGQLGIEAMRGAANAASSTGTDRCKWWAGKSGQMRTAGQRSQRSPVFPGRLRAYEPDFRGPDYDAGLYGPVMDAILKFDILPDGWINRL